MADDQQLWGYPEVAAHLGISVGAARNRKSRAACPRLTTPPCRTGHAGDPPRSITGTRSAEDFVATCIATPHRGSRHPADRRSRPPVGCGHDVRFADALPTVPFA